MLADNVASRIGSSPWIALFGADPSTRAGRSLMIQVIAYRLQERARGGFKPATRRLQPGG